MPLCNGQLPLQDVKGIGQFPLYYFISTSRMLHSIYIIQYDGIRICFLRVTATVNLYCKLCYEKNLSSSKTRGAAAPALKLLGRLSWVQKNLH